MNLIFQQLNKAFEGRVRIGIMSVLMVNDRMPYAEMKELLQVTDGNLSSHVNALEEAGFVKVSKKFVGKKPSTTYSLTSSGRKAFTKHLSVLESIINTNNNVK
jgi:DNA-binding MarR family transcriptional regulator